MIRLTLLLLGAEPLRARWRRFLALSGCCAVAGLVFIVDLFDTAIIVTTDLVGAVLAIEGAATLLRLAAIGFPNAATQVLRALIFFALGFLVIDVPWDDNILATIVIGAALFLDGAFRLAAAWLVRSVRWRQEIGVTLVEFVVATLVWLPWPVPHRHTVPFCFGVALLAAAWSLARLGLQLRRMAPGASVTDLPVFAGPNWHARGLVHPSLAQAAAWGNDAAMTVHVWTPVGSAEHARHVLLVDRYIAAMDSNGVISTGHAALSAPGLYVSLCPSADLDHSPTEFRHLLLAAPENDVEGSFRPSLREEAAAWKPPDREVAFDRYNNAALHAFFDLYRQTPVYNLTSRNCSSTVALSLDAAVEGALGGVALWRVLLRLFTDPAMWLLSMWRARAEAMTWTPGLVLDYAQTLRRVLEAPDESWFARLRGTRHAYQERQRALVAEGRPTRSNRPAVASLIATALIFGLTYGLTAPLLALALAQRGFGEGFIGANAAMHAVGVLAVAPLLPGLAWRVGPKLPIAAALLLAAGVLALFPVASAIWLWFPLRMALGAASETMFVMSETWLNQLSAEATRGRTMAAYTASLSVGFALGPVILAAVGTQGLVPYLVGGGVALLALLCVGMPWVRAPTFERPSHPNPLRYLALAPVALGATLANAALETAGMSFLPIYAMRAGWGERPATFLVSVLLLGAILLQLPIGWLGDRVDRRRLVIGLGAASAVGALAWPLVIDLPYLAYPLLFVWGGVFVGIYTITMTMVGSRFQGGDLVSLYAVMSVAWGIGAFAGPSAAGAAMSLTLHGLPYFAAATCAAFTLLALLRRRSA